jgi:hypothetical protein
MKLVRILLMTLVAFSIVSTSAFAGDFDWIRDFNIQAQVDPSGFKARLATRFHLGDVEVKTVLSNCDSFADAYLMLRLGEMSGRPTGYVIEKYRTNKEKGWGALAKSLGIKPGSEEFHALKRGHDLRGGSTKGQVLYSSYKNDHLNTIDIGHGKGGGKGKGKKKK